MSLEALLQRADIWRGETAPPGQSISTGFAPLDELLPGGGWPQGALTEVLSEREGIGELQLLLPALARLSRGERWIAFVAPPYIPYAPSLRAAGIDLARVLVIRPRTPADTYWAMEQGLRQGTCAACLTWMSPSDTKYLRRWQLAAEAGAAWAVSFRCPATQVLSSPAALRLQLKPIPRPATAREEALNVFILKRRGGWPVGPVALAFNPA